MIGLATHFFLELRAVRSGHEFPPKDAGWPGWWYMGFARRFSAFPHAYILSSQQQHQNTCSRGM